ncbi:hypothetical protein NUSPORA_01214 [Nucleospora cyclopteri]
MNHLLFIDDMKTFFNTIGLEMNKEKSATNSKAYMEDVQLLERKQDILSFC